MSIFIDLFVSRINLYTLLVSLFIAMQFLSLSRPFPVSAGWTLVPSLGIIFADMSGTRRLQLTIITSTITNGNAIKYLLLKYQHRNSIVHYYARLMMQRAPEKPCLNDVMEVGTWRRAVFATAITLVMMTLLPVWDELAEELGIGLVTSL